MSKTFYLLEKKSLVNRCSDVREPIVYLTSKIVGSEVYVSPNPDQLECLNETIRRSEHVQIAIPNGLEERFYNVCRGLMSPARIRKVGMSFKKLPKLKTLIVVEKE